MSHYILYPVRKRTHTRSGQRRRRLAASIGQMYLSGPLRELQTQWVKHVLNEVPAKERHPVDAIEDEFTLFKTQNYPDADGMWKLFLLNPLIGHTSIKSLLGNKAPGDVSLYKLITAAIDRLLLTSARTWWNKNRGTKLENVPGKWDFITQKSAAAEDTDAQAVKEKARALKGVDVPYKTKGMLGLTIDYWEQLLKQSATFPTLNFTELVYKFAPDFVTHSEEDLMMAAQDESKLLFANVAPIIESVGMGSIYDILEGALERAVWANSKHAVKHFDAEGTKAPPAQRERAVSRDEPTRELERQHKSNAPYDYPPVHSLDKEMPGYGIRNPAQTPVASVVYAGKLYELVK